MIKKYVFMALACSHRALESQPLERILSQTNTGHRLTE